ncbi:hypothetical protein WDW89_05755 [Deltaproteobacteria bacterium TL4]
MALEDLDEEQEEEGLKETAHTEPKVDSSVPEDFAQHLATRIVVIHEKEIDPIVSSENVASFINEQTQNPRRISYFIDATEVLLENERTEKYAALSWAALVIHSDLVSEYQIYVKNLIAAVVDGYYEMEKPSVQFQKKKFSAYSRIMGIVFIKMVDINSNLFDAAQELYSDLIRREMEVDAKSQDSKEEKKSIAFKKTTKKKKISVKFYDDIIDYIATRGDFKSTSLNQENPNEYIVLLADRLRGTRRYVIQDIMNKRALERKKRIEKELSDRLASAEDVIMASDPFCLGLSLFWREKRYNYKFLAVEKIRMALQVIAVIIGVLYFMVGYLNLWNIHWLEGILVCFGMYVFGKVAGSRKRFKSFYPYDVSKELEGCSTTFIAVMRRMSKDQLDHFLMRQVKNKRNESVIQVIPEFVKYLYAIMPDRKSMIISVDELSEVMENIEIDIAKQLRGRI